MKNFIVIFGLLVSLSACKNMQVSNSDTDPSSSKAPFQVGVENTEKRDHKLSELGIDFIALGHEPEWNLRLNHDSREAELEFVGKPTLALQWLEPMDESVEKMIFTFEGHEIVVITEKVECNDNMSGEAFGYQVRMLMDGKSYQGCGKSLKANEMIQAEPINPELFKTWVLSSWNGKALDPKQQPNITFDGQKSGVSGFSSCNRFNGTFFAAGKSMTFRPMAMTKMFCAQSIEMEFMERLQKTQQYNIEKDQLLLYDLEGKLLLTFSPSKD
jgi:heat shock protein HslJ